MAVPGSLNPIVGIDVMVDNAVYDEPSAPAVAVLGPVERKPALPRDATKR